MKLQEAVSAFQTTLEYFGAVSDFQAKAPSQRPGQFISRQNHEKRISRQKPASKSTGI